MKKMLIVFLVVIVVAQLGFANGQQEATQKSGKDSIMIGFTVNDFNDLWVTFVMDAVKEWDKENSGVTVALGNGQTDVNTQLGIVETWISQGYDAICVKPVEVEATVAMAKEAKAAGIPYIAVQQAIAEADAVVAQDSVRTGIDQMQAVAEALGGKGNVALMVGEPGTLIAQQRIEGNKKVLGNYPNISIVAEEIGNWQRDQGMSIMENWLQAGIEIDAVVASNDEMAIGAVLALEAAGVRDQYIVAGIDATPNGLAFMKEGRLDITMYADAKALAVKSLETAMELIKTGKAENSVISDKLVMPANVDEYLAIYNK
ncbi:substrate-binding domain-containing protein [Sediminispirochaeta smaragdinae]|uniref:Sugar ABC transporter (Sugar-binding protein) n=1 Tax=Sediminispirochaeta smaragdinae (strain DSM 11293 / JCM 15392 / SEBR 4228) TaxID=573413 RepID=E1R2I8_SEDSS|nr:substrate-binding domain-containing protein [Sediminispirochaeta smaragdinae]ADK82548.1 sugar ABC transporter (sugar-binding protein) [Sediminispirochaeta smaragdinae DSM 11293]